MVGFVAKIGLVEKAKVLTGKGAWEASCWSYNEGDAVAAESALVLGEDAENEGGGEGENGAVCCRRVAFVLEGYWVRVKGMANLLFGLVG